MINDWFDKQGKPLTDYAEIERLLSDINYKIIKQEELPSGLWVSTVWLGLNHRFLGEENEKPIIFETMVFSGKDKHGHWTDGIDQERYCTEKEAIKGHEKMVNKYLKIKKTPS